MDSNHRRRTPADLQSAPFGHSGIFPIFCWTSNLFKLEPMEGFEPTTPRLQITCSGQLSYIGNKPLRDAKVEIFFNSANFFATFFTFLLFFFKKAHFLRFQTLLTVPNACSKNPWLPCSPTKVGKSSANIITLSVRKKQCETFFHEKVKKMLFGGFSI